LPVLSESNAAAWIERAQQVTVRRLTDEVTWARDMRDRTGWWIEMTPPVLGAELDYSDAEVERHIRTHCDAAMVEELLDPARADADDADDYITLRISCPESLVPLVCDVLHAYSRPEEPPWRAFERILLHVKAAWEAQPKHRNPIHARDGWRCRVPACSSRRNLQEHHIQFRSHGGDNARTNRMSICPWHHHRAIHEGIIRAHGDAEGVVHWQIGIDTRRREHAASKNPDGRGRLDDCINPAGHELNGAAAVDTPTDAAIPLMQLDNDVYASA
jgi:hypothetical protein